MHYGGTVIVDHCRRLLLLLVVTLECSEPPQSWLVATPWAVAP